MYSPEEPIMTYLEYLSSIDDNSIKNKRKTSIGGVSWNIGRMDGGAQGACDKYLERFVILVPSAQKPSFGPRFELTFFLRKLEGSNQVAKEPADPVMISLTRHATEKYGCKSEYSYNESWNCEAHIVGKLCEIEAPDFENLVKSLKIDKMTIELEGFAEKLKAGQPYKSGKPVDYNFIRLENLNSFID
jgi:hypothetical protein